MEELLSIHFEYQISMNNIISRFNMLLFEDMNLRWPCPSRKVFFNKAIYHDKTTLPLEALYADEDRNDEMQESEAERIGAFLATSQEERTLDDIIEQAADILNTPLGLTAEERAKVQSIIARARARKAQL